jgi:hypothetical protein
LGIAGNILLNEGALGVEAAYFQALYGKLSNLFVFFCSKELIG